MSTLSVYGGPRCHRAGQDVGSCGLAQAQRAAPDASNVSPQSLAHTGSNDWQGRDRAGQRAATNSLWRELRADHRYRLASE
jgi:hypothetical protein